MQSADGPEDRMHFQQALFFVQTLYRTNVKQGSLNNLISKAAFHINRQQQNSACRISSPEGTVRCMQKEDAFLLFEP